MNSQLDRFADFLNHAWCVVEPLFAADKTGSLQIDSLQANWELIVEGSLSGESKYLTAYGDGADCNGASSRVLYPTRMATHQFVIHPLAGGELYDVLGRKFLASSARAPIFDRFVTFGEDRWYHERAPFDHILAAFEDDWVVLSGDAISIKLEKLCLP